MKAVVMQNNELTVKPLPDPEPRQGEVLLKTLACGICGSDLHMHHHCDDMLAGFKDAGIPIDFDPGKGVVFGHEYCAEVLDYGVGADRKLKPGTRICAMPYVITPDGFEHVGYSNKYSGGFGEQMILPESLLVPVPGDLPSDLAALTEPLAVGYHAVTRAGLAGNEVPIVIGCGPIGLAVIIALKAKGIGPVVAADFSESRRKLAEKLGADIVVNPTEQTPYQSWTEVAAPEGYDIHGPEAMLGVGVQPRPCVVFECVGIPGMIQQVFASAPPRTRLVVVGVCLQTDAIEPSLGIGKEMNVHFAFGYTAEEFTQTLHGLAEGKIDAASLITAKIGLEDVAAMFEELSNPEGQAKVIIEFD